MFSAAIPVIRINVMVWGGVVRSRNRIVGKDDILQGYACDLLLSITTEAGSCEKRKVCKFAKIDFC